MELWSNSLHQRHQSEQLSLNLALAPNELVSNTRHGLGVRRGSVRIAGRLYRSLSFNHEAKKDGVGSWEQEELVGSWQRAPSDQSMHPVRR